MSTAKTVYGTGCVPCHVIQKSNGRSDWLHAILDLSTCHKKANITVHTYRKGRSCNLGTNGARGFGARFSQHNQWIFDAIP